MADPCNLRLRQENCYEFKVSLVVFKRDKEDKRDKGWEGAYRGQILVLI